MEKKTIVFVFGTRPEYIKMLPLIVAAKKDPNINSVVCSTGQHREMLENLYKFFDLRPDVDFRLMKADQNLVNVHSETMTAMNAVIEKYQPNWVVVQGDTTSAHAAAMTAFYHKVAVAHVEAGLRTYDINSPFPEEMNRRAISLVAKLHLCPTTDAAANLKRELVDRKSLIVVTGNTGIDALKIVCQKNEGSDFYRNLFNEQFSFLGGDKFILATLHRRENFGSAQREILEAFLEIVNSRQINVLFPVHPNPSVRKTVNEVFSSELGKKVFWADKDENVNSKRGSGNIFLVDPLDYPALVYVMKKCDFLMTDSGGLQEEAPTFGKKILVLRKSTERPEGVSAGFSKLVGTDFNNIVNESYELIDREKHWSCNIPLNPFGDGHSSDRILKMLMN